MHYEVTVWWPEGTLSYYYRDTLQFAMKLAKQIQEEFGAVSTLRIVPKTVNATIVPMWEE